MTALSCGTHRVYDDDCPACVWLVMDRMEREVDAILEPHRLAALLDEPDPDDEALPFDDESDREYWERRRCQGMLDDTDDYRAFGMGL